MKQFKDDYHRESTEKEIDTAIESLKRAKKYGVKKNEFTATMWNMAEAIGTLTRQYEYIRSKYPEEYGDNK